MDSRARPALLVAEDEEALSAILAYNLEAEGFAVQTAGRGDEADLLIRERAPDLAIVDWMLPGLSGLEVIRRARARTETAALPIILLTARGEEADRVRGLDAGADDYLSKPFSVAELVARVRALLRRARPGVVARMLIAGDLELDRERHRVRRAGAPLHLGPIEFRLLDRLMQTPGRVLSRQQLLDDVWGSAVYVDERTVDVHVGRLRKALGTRGGADPIRTVRGAGYAFDETFGEA